MRTFFYVLFFLSFVIVSCKDTALEHALAEATLQLTETEELVQRSNLALEASHKRILLYEETKQNLVKASNEDYTLHLDIVDDNRLRFSLWEYPKSTSTLPKLVLYGGEAGKTGTWGVMQYTFDQREQRFIVETVPMRRGSKQYHVFLERLDNGTPKYYGKMTNLKTTPH
ncbi:MAG: hypothetical protein AAF969_06335 [Bacteroidota bacterium]